jgi:hypothetical protein
MQTPILIESATKRRLANLGYLRSCATVDWESIPDPEPELLNYMPTKGFKRDPGHEMARSTGLQITIAYSGQTLGASALLLSETDSESPHADPTSPSLAATGKPGHAPFRFSQPPTDHGGR